jgi:RNA polymerase sigma-70 factor (ECF subfamily)
MVTPTPPNPLLSEDPLAWDRLIEALPPAAMLVAIASRMGPELRTRHAPEDVWQDTLLMAWRDRARCEWRGMAEFRRWLLSIAQHRLSNLADYEGARKRGGQQLHVPLMADSAPDSRPSYYAGPVASTTPSRVASDRETAMAMERALTALPDDLREVVRLRMFEGLLIEQIASQLGLGESAVRHRFRRGVEQFNASMRETGGLPA